MMKTDGVERLLKNTDALQLIGQQGIFKKHRDTSKTHRC